MNSGGTILTSLLIVQIAIFIGVFALVAFWIYKAYKKNKAELEKFNLWVVNSNYQMLTESQDPGLSFSSFKEGRIIRGFNGELTQAKNSFSLCLQTETRGSGKNRRDYKRTIVNINIPDTQLQLIINSKINNDSSSGGNLDAFSKDQRFSLEGDFGEFFDVFMPSTTQSESLTFLSPNSMMYIMNEFVDYDIEINGPKMYLYTYKHISQAEMVLLLQKLEVLLMELRLRKDDIRQEKVTNALVARTATDASTTHRSLKKDFQWLGIALFVLYFLADATRNPILTGSLFVVFIVIFIKFLIDLQTQYRLKRKYKQVIESYR